MADPAQVAVAKLAVSEQVRATARTARMRMRMHAPRCGAAAHQPTPHPAPQPADGAPADAELDPVKKAKKDEKARHAAAACATRR
jgi:hypothetical protein